MPLYISTDEIGTVLLDDDEIVKIYVGEDLVYQAVEDTSSQNNP